MRNYLPTIVVSIAIVASGLAHAGVAEKKARRAAEENAAAEVALLKSSCGNPDMLVQFDWDAFDILLDTEKAKIEKRGDKNEWVIDKAAERTVNVIKALSGICSNDADYKEEIAKVTALNITPKASFEDYESVFTLNDAAITVETGHVMNRSPEDFEDRLLALF